MTVMEESFYFLMTKNPQGFFVRRLLFPKELPLFIFYFDDGALGWHHGDDCLGYRGDGIFDCHDDVTGRYHGDAQDWYRDGALGWHHGDDWGYCHDGGWYQYHDDEPHRHRDDGLEWHLDESLLLGLRLSQYRQHWPWHIRNLS
jgi:hypothetical protein